MQEVVIPLAKRLAIFADGSIGHRWIAEVAVPVEVGRIVVADIVARGFEAVVETVLVVGVWALLIRRWGWVIGGLVVVGAAGQENRGERGESGGVCDGRS